MAKSRRNWTKEEDKILVQAIKANPHNKAEAFRQASTKLDRDSKSCENRWYQHLSNEFSKHYVGTLFTMVGYHTRMDNRTINREGVHITPKKNKRGIWTKIRNLLNL